MSPSFRCCAFVLVLLSVPAVAGPPREDRRAARLRAASVRPDPAEVQPSEAAPIAAAAADASGIDLAGFLGMLTALTATFVYARGWRLSAGRAPARPPSVIGPPERK